MLKTTEAQTQPTVMVVAGAGNVRERHHSALEVSLLPAFVAIDRLHAKTTRVLHRAIAEMSAHHELVVPHNYGMGLPTRSYKRTAAVLDQKLEKHDGERILLVGHSLGAFIATIYSHDHPEQNIETIAFAGPFHGVNLMPFSARLFAEHTQRIRDIRTDMGSEAPKLTLVGTQNDILVPVHSALPDLPNADKVLFTAGTELATDGEWRTIAADSAPGHLSILNHPESLAICQQAVSLQQLQPAA